MILNKIIKIIGQELNQNNKSVIKLSILGREQTIQKAITIVEILKRNIKIVG